MRIRGILAFIALALPGCYGGSQSVIDLSCDIIRSDAVQDVHRIEVRQGARLDSSLLARVRGHVLVRAYNHRDSSRLDRPLRAVLTNTGTRAQSGVDSDQPNRPLEPAAGVYSLSVTCVGCSRTETALTVVSGRVDTVDAYLTRFPTNCEADGGRRAPPG